MILSFGRFARDRRPLAVWLQGFGPRGRRQRRPGFAEAVPRGQDVRRQTLQGAIGAHLLLLERGDLREEHGDLH